MRPQSLPVRMDSASLLDGAAMENQSVPTVQMRLTQSAVSSCAHTLTHKHHNATRSNTQHKHAQVGQDTDILPVVNAVSVILVAC